MCKLTSQHLYVVFDETHTDYVVWDSRTNKVVFQSIGPEACMHYIFQKTKDKLNETIDRF